MVNFSVIAVESLKGQQPNYYVRNSNNYVDDNVSTIIIDCTSTTTASVESPSRLMKTDAFTILPSLSDKIPGPPTMPNPYTVVPPIVGSTNKPSFAILQEIPHNPNSSSSHSNQLQMSSTDAASPSVAASGRVSPFRGSGFKSSPFRHISTCSENYNTTRCSRSKHPSSTINTVRRISKSVSPHQASSTTTDLIKNTLKPFNRTVSYSPNRTLKILEKFSDDELTNFVVNGTGLCIKHSSRNNKDNANNPNIIKNSTNTTQTAASKINKHVENPNQMKSEGFLNSVIEKAPPAAPPRTKKRETGISKHNTRASKITDNIDGCCQRDDHTGRISTISHRINFDDSSKVIDKSPNIPASLDRRNSKRAKLPITTIKKMPISSSWKITSSGPDLNQNTQTAGRKNENDNSRVKRNAPPTITSSTSETIKNDAVTNKKKFNENKSEKSRAPNNNNTNDKTKQAKNKKSPSKLLAATFTRLNTTTVSSVNKLTMRPTSIAIPVSLIRKNITAGLGAEYSNPQHINSSTAKEKLLTSSSIVSAVVKKKATLKTDDNALSVTKEEIEKTANGMMKEFKKEISATAAAANKNGKSSVMTIEEADDDSSNEKEKNVITDNKDEKNSLLQHTDTSKSLPVAGHTVIVTSAPIKLIEPSATLIRTATEPALAPLQSDNNIVSKIRSALNEQSNGRLVVPSPSLQQQVDSNNECGDIIIPNEILIEHSNHFELLPSENNNSEFSKPQAMNSTIINIEDDCNIISQMKTDRTAIQPAAATNSHVKSVILENQQKLVNNTNDNNNFNNYCGNSDDVSQTIVNVKLRKDFEFEKQLLTNANRQHLRTEENLNTPTNESLITTATATADRSSMDALNDLKATADISSSKKSQFRNTIVKCLKCLYCRKCFGKEMKCAFFEKFNFSFAHCFPTFCIGCCHWQRTCKFEKNVAYDSVENKFKKYLCTLKCFSCSNRNKSMFDESAEELNLPSSANRTSAFNKIVDNNYYGLQVMACCCCCFKKCACCPDVKYCRSSKRHSVGSSVSMTELSKSAKQRKKRQRRWTRIFTDFPKLDSSFVEHGSVMRASIPVLPVPLAWICLVMNVFLPGFGTLLSGIFCVLVGKPRYSTNDSILARFGSLLVNIVVAASQLFTVLFCLVGWGWSIWWSILMLRMASHLLLSLYTTSFYMALLILNAQPIEMDNNNRYPYYQDVTKIR